MFEQRGDMHLRAFGDLTRPATDLLVALQRAETLLDDLAETGEPAAQAVEPAGVGLASARLGDVGEAVGAPVAGALKCGSRPRSKPAPPATPVASHCQEPDAR